MVAAASVIRCLLSLSCIIFNSFLIFALQRRKKLKLISYWLIFCLSSSDVFFGIFGLINESLVLKLKGACWNNDLCYSTSCIEFFFTNFSATFLLIIAIDRFIHMRYSLRYQSIMTRGRAILLFCFNVIFTFHIVVTIMLLPKYQREFLLKHLLSYRIYRAVLSLVYLLIVVAVCVLYIITYVSIKKRVNNTTHALVTVTRGGDVVRENKIKEGEPNVYKQRRRPDQDFAICIMLIILLILAFEAPNLCINAYIRVAMLFQPRFTYSNEIVLATNWTYLLMQLNSTLNAVVLLVFSRELRKYTKTVFTRSSNTERV